MKKGIKFIFGVFVVAIFLVSCQPQNNFWPGYIPGIIPPSDDDIEDDAITAESTEQLLALISNAVPGTPITIKLTGQTYNGQLNIKEGTDITIIGENENSSVIALPEDISSLEEIDIYTDDSSSGKYTGYIGIVQAKDAKLTLKNLTITGDPEGTKNSQMAGTRRQAGIMAINTELYAENVTITDMRYDDTTMGVQNGISVYLVGEGSGKPAYFSNCTISDFNKGAIVARDSVSHLTFINGKIIGEGQTSLTAQNGIQFSCPATITGNTISDIWYITPDNGTLSLATGIYNYNAPSCTISGNTFINVNQRFVYSGAPDEIQQMINEDTIAYYLNAVSKANLLAALKSSIGGTESGTIKAKYTIPDNIMSGWDGRLDVTITFTNSTDWTKNYTNKINLTGSAIMTLTGGNISSDSLTFTGYELKSDAGLTFGEDNNISFSGIAGDISITATLSGQSITITDISGLTIPEDGTGITLRLNSEDVSYENVIEQLDSNTSV